MSPRLIDQWFLNVLFQRKRLFKVNLEHCRDEFGGRFGYHGGHFFVEALKNGEDFNTVYEYLRSYYLNNQIMSFNQTICHKIRHPDGSKYFCPWEKGRVREVEKFVGSHKIGPTSELALQNIVIRLLSVLDLLKRNGFKQFSILNGFPRIIPIKFADGQTEYLIRDGQHRLAALSYLGIKNVKVCSESAFWENSMLYRVLARQKSRLLGKEKSEISEPILEIIDETDASNWPHVICGKVTKKQAIRFFEKKFKHV